MGTKLDKDKLNNGNNKKPSKETEIGARKNPRTDVASKQMPVSSKQVSIEANLKTGQKLEGFKEGKVANDHTKAKIA